MNAKGGVIVREINLGKAAERRKFVDVLWSLYRPAREPGVHDPWHCWVPPLRLAAVELLKPTHPFYASARVKAFIADRNGRPAGRVMAIHNHRYNEFHGVNAGFYGFFESLDDDSVARSLLQACEAFLRARGADTMYGPVNPSTNYECGLLVRGFEDPPQIMMPYNPPFYGGLLENTGQEKAKDLIAYRFDVYKGFPDVVRKAAQRAESLKSRDVVFRPVEMKSWRRDIRMIKAVYNEAWRKNWGFVPMTDAEFDHMAAEMKRIIDPDLALVCTVDGEAAGFILTLPDYNQVFKRIPSGRLLPGGLFKLLRPQKHIDRLRTLTMGVREKFRKLGLETAFYHKSCEAGKAKNYREAEFSWVLEDNDSMNKPLLRLGTTPYKTYRIYQKPL